MHPSEPDPQPRARQFSNLKLAFAISGSAIATIVGAISAFDLLPTQIQRLPFILLLGPSLFANLTLVLVLVSRRAEQAPTPYRRTYDLVWSKWYYRPSTVRPDRWGALHVGRRVVRAVDSGLSYLNVQFAKGEENIVPFTLEHPPVVRLEESSRSQPGDCRLAPPHRRTGSTFAFRIYFEPPLQKSEVADVQFTIDFPMYRFATREEMISATTEAGTVRDHDFLRRSVDYPTRRLLLSVFLQDALKARPRKLKAQRERLPFPDEERMIESLGAYTATRASHQGNPGWLLQLDRSDPPLHAQYVLSWTLPSQSEIGE